MNGPRRCIDRTPVRWVLERPGTSRGNPKRQREGAVSRSFINWPKGKDPPASELSDKNPCLQHAHRFVISPVLQVWIWVCRKVTIIEHQRLDISGVFINCSIFLVQRLYFLIAPVESKDSH